MKKLLKVSSVVAILAGIILVAGGVWGIAFTYKNVARENIVTPTDATVPNLPVRGPMSLKVQGDIIRTHTLKMTGGKTFAEMPRQIAKLDQNGKEVLDEKGQPVMVPNTARDIWITATTLMVALNLGIVTYAFAGLAVLLGFVFILIGAALGGLGKRF